MARPRGTGAFRSVIACWCCAALIALAALPIPAFSADPGKASARPTPGRSGQIGFSRFTPDSVGLFVSVDKLATLNAGLNRANVWRFVSWMLGLPGEAQGPIDLSKALIGVLGLPDSVTSAALAQCEFGLALSSSWDIPGAVWFVRLPGDRAVERWFPPARRASGGVMGAVRFFELRSGVMVCVRGDTVAVSHRWGSGTLLEKTMQLMSGRETESLAKSASFRDAVAYLPDDDLALVYVVDPRGHGPKSGTMPSIWPDVRSAAVGFYGGDGRVDVAIRASLEKPYAQSKLAWSAVDRFLRLPQTTLFAAALRVDLSDAGRQGLSDGATGVLDRFFSFLGALQGSADRADNETARLGPHVLVVWGQDLSPDTSTPQLALMIECHDGRFVRDRMERTVEGLLRFADLVETAPHDHPLAIVQRRHVGSTIYHVPLAERAAVSALPAMKLLRNTDPAWTIWNGWLIIALSRDHLERILESQYGLLPILATERDLERIRRRATDRSELVVMQADLATDVLSQWVAAHESGEPSLLDRAWWGGTRLSGASGEAGLIPGVTLDAEPAVAIVSAVDNGSPAHDRLRVGDRIVGINGRVLSLDDPVGDLKRRWNEGPPGPGATIRILRGGRMTEVTLSTSSAARRRRPDPAEALRELISVGSALEFGSYSVDVSDPQHYSALLSLRFRPARVSNATSD